MQELVDRINRLVADAEALIPDSLEADLPPGPYSSGQPEWHTFEHRIWDIGEKIRQTLLEKVSLRKNEELQHSFLRVSMNRNAKRGRQSFIMLLGYKNCQAHAASIATQIDDPGVEGHVISTLCKMQAPGFADEVLPFTQNKIAWIRKAATRYCRRFGDPEQLPKPSPRRAAAKKRSSSKHDWYRNTAWSAEIAEAFWARLNRSRSSFNKAQYLRIQAVTLIASSESRAALELLDAMIEQFPEPSELASAHHSRAQVLASLGREREALGAFREAISAQGEFSSIQTDSALDFGEFAVLNEMTEVYDEIEEVVSDFIQSSPILLPVQRFKVLAIGALVEEKRNNFVKARELAHAALDVAAQTESGFAKHPKLGLVGGRQKGLLDAVSALVAA